MKQKKKDYYICSDCQRSSRPRKQLCISVQPRWYEHFVVFVKYVDTSLVFHYRSETAKRTAATWSPVQILAEQQNMQLR